MKNKKIVAHENLLEKSQKQFRDLTFSMDIPKERREPTQTNIKWFLRNGAIFNMKHPNYEPAIKLARQMLIV
jgi:hypothetical protein